MSLSAHRPRPGASPDNPRTRVNVALIGVFVLFAILWAFLLWYRYDETIATGERRASNLALVLAEHLHRSADAVDAALVQLTLQSQRMGGPKAAPDAWVAALPAALSTVPGVSSLTVTDEQGIVVASSARDMVGRSQHDMYLFRRLAGRPEGLVANTPVKDAQSGHLMLPLGRALTGPDGAFAGVAVAMLDAEPLRDLYRAIDVGRHGMVTVVHPEGAIMFREPASSDGAGAPAQNDPIFLAQRDRPAGGELRGPLVRGGPSYLSAYRTLSSPPLAVAVSLAEKEVLGSWWHVTLLAVGLTSALGVALLLAAYLIMREIRDRTAATDRLVETDAALRASQQRLRALMEHTPLMVTEKDLSGRYIFVNRAFEERLGISAAKAVGHTAYDIFDQDRADAQTSMDREVVATRGPLQQEIVVASPSGPRTVLFTKFPLLDAGGAVEAIGTIGVDVTDLKQAEVQLAHAQKMEAVGQLTGGVAHDFNNLLTAILLNADVLADRIGDDKLRPLAEATRVAAERGADLTKRLLAFGRRQMLEPRPTDVNALVGGMEQLMQRTLGERVEVEIRAMPELWTAKVDPGQLEAAVLNLAVNARDAMPQGGRITIETSNVEIDETFAANNADVKPGEYIMVAVGDTGTGMPPDVLARAFEPFFTTKAVGKGTGLGLSMVYGFVKQSGGHSRIYSEIGVGTVVRLYLPRAEVGAEVAAVRPKVVSELPRGAETILLVEDDPLVRKHTENQLSSLGYKVIAAENAAQAMERIEAQKMPDLLFTDIVMPGAMNGRDLAERLRQRWPTLKVLYTSGFSHGMLDAPLGPQVTAKHLLGKPFRRRDLANKVREVLDEPAAA